MHLLSFSRWTDQPWSSGQLSAIKRNELLSYNKTWRIHKCICQVKEISLKRSILCDSNCITKLCPTPVTPWAVAHQTPLSMGFSRQEYWSRLPFPPWGDLSDSVSTPVSPALHENSLLSEPPGKQSDFITFWKRKSYRNNNNQKISGSQGFRGGEEEWIGKMQGILRYWDFYMIGSGDDMLLCISQKGTRGGLNPNVNWEL